MQGLVGLKALDQHRTLGNKVGPMSKMTTGQRHLSTSGPQNCQQNANVRPTNDCYLIQGRLYGDIQGSSNYIPVEIWTPISMCNTMYLTMLSLSITYVLSMVSSYCNTINNSMFYLFNCLNSYLKFSRFHNFIVSRAQMLEIIRGFYLWSPVRIKKKQESALKSRKASLSINSYELLFVFFRIMYPKGSL